GGVLHILMNSWAMFDLGAEVENTYGTSRYLVIYFVSTITGYLASFWWKPYIVSIGASAGIFGLIGAMIAIGTRERTSYAAAMRGAYLRWAGIMLVIGLLGYFAIDNAAHIGGGIGGFIVGYAAGMPRVSGPRETFWRALAGVCIAITILAFLEMFLRF